VVELGTTLGCSDVESDDFVADKVIARRCSFRDLDRHALALDYVRRKTIRREIRKQIEWRRKRDDAYSV